MYRFIVPLIAAGFLLLAERTAAAQSPPGTAYQQLAAAREQVRAAQADLDRISGKAKEDLASSDPQWAKLQSDYAAAQKHRDEVKNGLMKAYLESADYVAGQEAIKKAERRMIELTDARDTAQDEFEVALNSAWDTRGKLRNLQRVQVDDAPELRSAEMDLRHAKELRDAYWKNYASTTLSQDPAWAAATARKDSATHAVEAAEGQVAEMRRQAASNRPQRQYTPRSGGGGRSGPSRRSSSMSRGY